MRDTIARACKMLQAEKERDRAQVALWLREGPAPGSPALDREMEQERNRENDSVELVRRERANRRQDRYQREEKRAERIRVDLETTDRETWIADTLETEERLG